MFLIKFLALLFFCFYPVVPFFNSNKHIRRIVITIIVIFQFIIINSMVTT